MSRAAKQLREWIVEQYPGVRISRKACRDTAGGFISQHSAYDYGEYDSNALDIMGGPLGWTWDQNVALIDAIVTEIRKHEDDWSIRLILWKVKDHYGHAHIDLWPTCRTYKWCGRDIDPLWQTSWGQEFNDRDPDPENGDYHGPTEEGELMPRALFENMITALFAIGEEFKGDPDYWIDRIDEPDNPEWTDFFAAYSRQLAKG